MRPPYLTGERVYVRALLATDKDTAIAWHGGPFPINAVRAETVLREAYHTPGWRRERWRLGIARRDTDVLIGGLTLSVSHWRRAWLDLQLAPMLDDPDAWRAETLRLVIPWLRDEGEFMTVTVAIEADQPATVAAADALGMVQVARLRERVARPGGRMDQFRYQALNPRWEVEANA
jgi:RimJ/RimL family protein N-acetyltransferase